MTRALPRSRATSSWSATTAPTRPGPRGAELEVVYSWHYPHIAAGFVLPNQENLAEREGQVRDLIMQAIEPWAGKYPDLEVAPSFTHESPAAFLVDRSASADLLVVGSH